jgi:hypothetical protein
VSKLAAGREKDLDFARADFHHRLLQTRQVEDVLNELEPTLRETVKTRLFRCASGV